MLPVLIRLCFCVPGNELLRTPASPVNITIINHTMSYNRLQSMGGSRMLFDHQEQHQRPGPHARHYFVLDMM